MSRDFEIPDAPAEGGESALASQFQDEIEKELCFSAFWDGLADAHDLIEHPPKTFSVEQLDEQQFFHNTGQVWLEITNTLHQAKYLLAQSRAYKIVEISRKKNDGDYRNVHLTKISTFDQAVYLISKIENLFLLLIFVNLGNFSGAVNLERSDWQKQIDWDCVKRELKKYGHPPPESNPYLDCLSKSEYKLLLKAVRSYKGTSEMSKN